MKHGRSREEVVHLIVIELRVYWSRREGRAGRALVEGCLQFRQRVNSIRGQTFLQSEKQDTYFYSNIDSPIHCQKTADSVLSRIRSSFCLACFSRE
jgi:hypothetical protein